MARKKQENIAEAIRRRFARYGGLELELPEREPPREPPDFCDMADEEGDAATEGVHTSKRNLGILLSGRGSNFEAIADNIASGALNATIAVVISNRADAPGIESARRRGLNALVVPSQGKVREEHDRAVVAALREHQVDLICLAGYMRLLSPWFVQQFPNRILNIHPSLLPAFPGLEAQRQAFDYGVKVSGCTVHFVDENLDHGAILVQKVVPVLDSDDEHSLAARILEQEHIAYSEAIGFVLAGNFRIEGRRVVLQGLSGDVTMLK